MIITVPTWTLNPAFQLPGSSGTIRLYYTDSFNSGGVSVQGSPVRSQHFFDEMTWTTAAGVMTIDTFTNLISTTNSREAPAAQVIGEIYVGNTYIGRAFAWKVPDSLGATVTKEALDIYNTPYPPRPPRPGFLDEDQINNLIAAALGSRSFAAVGVAGIIETTVDPVDPSHPKAVGDNDRRVGAAYNVKATAIGAVGDGTTNDRAALNTLANTTLQIAGAGGDIYFPAGDYSIQSNMTFPANVRLILDPHARLKPANGVTITDLTDHSSWDLSQKFTNALAGQGTISFAGAPIFPISKAEWWAVNTVPGTTNMTSAWQAAITATGGRGRVKGSTTSYLITESLTVPALLTTFSPLVIEGDGPFLSNLINKASAGKPTLLIDRDLVTVRGMGFWGDGAFINNGIKVSVAGRIYIENNHFMVQGNAIYLESAQSVFIRNNYGSVSGGSGLKPTGVTTTIVGWAATDSFVYVNLPNGGFMNHLVVNGNMNEGYSYQVYTALPVITAVTNANPAVITSPAHGFANGQVVTIRDVVDTLGTAINGARTITVLSADTFSIPVDTSASSVYAGGGTVAGTGAGTSFQVKDNQFEGSTNGIKMTGVSNYEISGNYMQEGSTGYAIDNDNCRNGRIGPNYIHFVGNDSKVNTVKLNDELGTVLTGSISRLYLTGTSLGLIAESILILRLQDESSDHLLSFDNSVMGGGITVPLSVLNSRAGRATWFAANTTFLAYPTVRLGDQIEKLTPTSGASPGWVATTASSAGALVQVTGSGPDPTVLGDYAEPVAYDFRITMLSGGVTGTATYKVEWKTAGGGVYADLTLTTTTTEMAHLITRETGGGDPTVTFSVRWPTGATYVSGDQWTLTAVVAPIWKATAALA